MIGIELDSAGWVAVADLLRACAKHGHPIQREQLDEVVATNAKQRFAMSADGTKIRANQGHSLPVELGYAAAVPPPELFHGTVASALAAIFSDGLTRRARHHVHLSLDRAGAEIVGSRRGKPVVLSIDAGGMACAGYTFYCTPNGVWLTDEVPPQFIGRT